jgi:hypothetical protein
MHRTNLWVFFPLKLVVIVRTQRIECNGNYCLLNRRNKIKMRWSKEVRMDIKRIKGIANIVGCAFLLGYYLAKEFSSSLRLSA